MLERTSFELAFLPDAHLDHMTPVSEAWKVAKKFIWTWQPKIIVLGGDFMEMGALSHWLKDKRRLMEGRRYNKDIALANRELDEIQELCPDSQIDFIMGNHEDWLYQYLERHPEMEGTIDLVKDLRFEERGIRFTPLNEVLTIGHMNYIHGWYVNMYHAKRTLQRMGDNVMYGHMHHYQVDSLRLRAKNRWYVGIACGCLCDLNPYYKRNRPNDWTHGLGYVEYREDGTFTPYHINIINGELSYGGETIRVRLLH
jgi:predicted MPP superfamily phosphohydrolase